METERTTTQFASTLIASTTRRGALCFLAGLAMAGSGLAVLSGTDADAKNKKKGKKNNGKGKGTCDRRKPLARLKVSHDGSVVHTPKLENGRRYRLRVSESVVGTAPLFPQVGVDAGYLFRQDGGDTIAKDSAEGLDFGLWIDDEAVAWGGYNGKHVYERVVKGEGEKLALHLVTEPESGLSQGAGGQVSAQRIISTPVDFEFAGSLTVEVFCD
jgi:hypothetical protein